MPRASSRLLKKGTVRSVRQKEPRIFNFKGDLRMLLRLALAAAATMSVLSAQNWEFAPVGGYLKLSKKVIGSANLDSPKDDDTTLHSRQPVYGMRLTRNTKGYWGFEL